MLDIGPKTEGLKGIVKAWIEIIAQAAQLENDDLQIYLNHRNT